MSTVGVSGKDSVMVRCLYCLKTVVNFSTGLCFWSRQYNGQMFILFENSRELFYWFCLEKNWKFTSVWNWHEIIFIEVSFLFFSVPIEHYLFFFGVGYLSTKCFFFLLFTKSANRSYPFFPRLRLDMQSIFPGRFQQSLSLPSWQNLFVFTPR